MRFVFAILAMFTCLTLCAKHDTKKLVKAFMEAHLHKNENSFFYKLSEDSEEIRKIEEMNQSDSQKTYGPYQLMLKGMAPGTRFKLYQCNLLWVTDPLFVYYGYFDQESGWGGMGQTRR